MTSTKAGCECNCHTPNAYGFKCQCSCRPKAASEGWEADFRRLWHHGISIDEIGMLTFIRKQIEHAKEEGMKSVVRVDENSLKSSFEAGRTAERERILAALEKDVTVCAFDLYKVRCLTLSPQQDTK